MLLGGKKCLEVPSAMSSLKVSIKPQEWCIEIIEPSQIMFKAILLEVVGASRP